MNAERITPLQQLSRAVLVLLALTLLALAAPALAKKPKAPEDLFNPFLGLEYSYWLVGAIAEIATEAEIDAYLRLASDAEAQSFIANFWEKRNAGTAVFTKTPQQLYEARSVEADKRFTERAYPGRRSDRGTTLILYGEPEKIEFTNPLKVNDYTLEAWNYAKDAAAGLNGKKPPRQVRFVEIEGKTVFFRGQSKRPDPREQLRRQQRGGG